MSFRTLEITNPTEIHIKNNQLELTQENRQIYIPIDSSESLAAKDYFQLYHEGLNRRNDAPVNSRLNYGFPRERGY